MDHPFSFNIDITATLKPLDQEIVLEMHRKQSEIREKLSTQILRLKERSVREALVKMGWTPPAETTDLWQPIETAPHGERILLLHEVRLFSQRKWDYVSVTHQIVEGWFVDGNWEPWQGQRTRCTNKLKPTHWMLKPMPPTR